MLGILSRCRALRNFSLTLVLYSVKIFGGWSLDEIRRIMSQLRRSILSSLIGAVIVSIALSACKSAPPPSVEHKSDPALAEKVQSLQRQIQERDKRIEELESQLEALKMIDQDLEKQRKPIRPPTTLEPAQ